MEDGMTSRKVPGFPAHFIVGRVKVRTKLARSLPRAVEMTGRQAQPMLVGFGKGRIEAIGDDAPGPAGNHGLRPIVR